jgi:hypothetical protein
MGAEGTIAITAGILAGSIALVGFGIDWAIEGVASIVIVWRFTGHRLLSHAAEERAQKLVVIQFFLLAPYVGFEAVRHLVGAEHPDVSVLGMALTAASLVGMPFLGIAKQRLAERLGSSATHGEGSQNLICAYLAGAVFLGLAGNEVFGWWWLDRSRRSRSLASRSGRAPRPGAGRLLRRPGAHPGGRLRGRLLRVAPVVWRSRRVDVARATALHRSRPPRLDRERFATSTWRPRARRRPV